MMRSYPLLVPHRPQATLRMVMVSGPPDYARILGDQLERLYPLLLAWLWILAFAAIDAGRPWTGFGFALMPGLFIGTMLWPLTRGRR